MGDELSNRSAKEEEIMYCQHCGEEYRFPGWLIGHVCETMRRDYIHPSQLPDGPERDAWIEAEAEYASKHDPIRLPLKENEMCGIKAPQRSWLHRLCARMMQ